MSTNMEHADRHQTAVLWEATGFDEFGNVTVSSPVELKVRWQSIRQELTQTDGTVKATDSSVVVNRQITEGSIMRLGTLATTPNPPTNLKRVVRYNETPSLKNRFVRQTVDLETAKGVLPTLTTT